MLETLDEDVYFDGICTFLKDDGKGNWLLNLESGCENEFALTVEILRMTEGNVGPEMKEAFERLLSKVCDMVEVKGEEVGCLVMKYQVTQALWENIMGKIRVSTKGASRPVEMVSWLDCVIFANKISEKEGLEKVYEIPEGMEEKCKNQIDEEDYILMNMHRTSK